MGKKEPCASYSAAVLPSGLCRPFPARGLGSPLSLDTVGCSRVAHHHSDAKLVTVLSGNSCSF